MTTQPRGADAAADEMLAQISPELWRRMQQLENAFVAPNRAAPAWRPPQVRVPAPGRTTRCDVDVAILGGGLSLLLAPVLARRGLTVAVVEQHKIGAAHREWNASGDELEGLVRGGVCTAAELETTVVNRYRHGVCRWHDGGTYPVHGVLDHAVDAQRLLDLAREQATGLGVQFVPHTFGGGEHASDHGITLGLWHAPDGIPTSTDQSPPQSLTARVLVDARGAQSPYATADLVCPTVGGVMADLEGGQADDQVDPHVGDILATTEHAEGGRQHLWEAFPGQPNRTTVYLFYYALRQDVPAAALTQLYARFAARLRHYKRGPARLVRPTFGFIPGWSRLTPAPRAPHHRIVLVGDAAARHSPLTFCGFGGMLRSLPIVGEAVAARVEGRAAPTATVDDRPVHRGTGALARIMAVPNKRRPQALNRLLDAAFCSLHAMGPEPYAALLQDRMPIEQFLRFLWRTSRRHPEVWREVARSLGVAQSLRWSAGLAWAVMASGPARALPP